MGGATEQHLVDPNHSEHAPTRHKAKKYYSRLVENTMLLYLYRLWHRTV